MQHKKNSVSTPLNKQRIKLILGVINDSKLMYENGDDTITEDPTQWNYKDFKAWKQNRYPTSTASHTVSLAMMH